jgi:hypothetical protein
MRKLGLGVLGGFAAGMLALALPPLSGCQQSTCGDVGCGTSATLSVDVPDDVVLPEGTTVTACFNDGCVVGALPAPDTIPPGSSAGISFPPGAKLFATEWAADATEHDRVEVQWFFDYGTALHAGDRYRVTLTDLDGVEIATKEATVASYGITYPNGSSCAPACPRARFP